MRGSVIQSFRFGTAILSTQLCESPFTQFKMLNWFILHKGFLSFYGYSIWLCVNRKLWNRSLWLSLLWIYEYHIEWNMANGTFDWNFSLLFEWGCVSYTWRVKDWVGHSLRKIQICCFQWYFSHSSNLGLPPRGSWEYCYKSIGNVLRQKFYHLQVPASTTESDKPWKSQEAIFASIVG